MKKFSLFFIFSFSHSHEDDEDGEEQADVHRAGGKGDVGDDDVGGDNGIVVLLELLQMLQMPPSS